MAKGVKELARKQRGLEWPKVSACVCRNWACFFERDWVLLTFGVRIRKKKNEERRFVNEKDVPAESD